MLWDGGTGQFIGYFFGDGSFNGKQKFGYNYNISGGDDFEEVLNLVKKIKNYIIKSKKI